MRHETGWSENKATGTPDDSKEIKSVPGFFSAWIGKNKGIIFTKETNRLVLKLHFGHQTLPTLFLHLLMDFFPLSKKLPFNSK